jgi:hypothetical protein
MLLELFAAITLQATLLPLQVSPFHEVRPAFTQGGSFVRSPLNSLALSVDFVTPAGRASGLARYGASHVSESRPSIVGTDRHLSVDKPPYRITTLFDRQASAMRLVGELERAEVQRFCQRVGESSPGHVSRGRRSLEIVDRHVRIDTSLNCPFGLRPVQLVEQRQHDVFPFRFSSRDTLRFSPAWFGRSSWLTDSIQERQPPGPRAQFGMHHRFKIQRLDIRPRDEVTEESVSL